MSDLAELVRELTRTADANEARALHLQKAFNLLAGSLADENGIVRLSKGTVLDAERYRFETIVEQKTGAVVVKGVWESLDDSR